MLGSEYRNLTVLGVIAALVFAAIAVFTALEIQALQRYRGATTDWQVARDQLDHVHDVRGKLSIALLAACLVFAYRAGTNVRAFGVRTRFAIVPRNDEFPRLTEYAGFRFLKWVMLLFWVYCIPWSYARRLWKSASPDVHVKRDPRMSPVYLLVWWLGFYLGQYALRHTPSTAATPDEVGGFVVGNVLLLASAIAGVLGVASITVRHHRRAAAMRAANPRSVPGEVPA